MKTLYLDCFSGISGDMLLGALVDLGVDSKVLIEELSKLNVDGYDISFEKKTKQGIGGTDANVNLHHDHHHDHLDSHNHHHSRNLADIIHIIDTSAITSKAKSLSKMIFTEIASAEARVHMKPIEEVHFHEVGAIDSIVDIVGVCICLDQLGVEVVYSSELHDGKGFIKCQHGTIPVPVPAVMEMLKGSGIPLIQDDIGTELVTPTGFAIVKCIVNSFGPIPVMNIDGVGYGFGKRETGGFNAIRVLLGDSKDKKGLEDLIVLETNIDNISGEILGYTMERVFAEGALDVFHTPIYMKKNRPAVMLSVITKPDNEVALVDTLLRETSTLGIRRYAIERYVMEREIIKVNTKYGEVGLKKAWLGDINKYSPEFEDCAKIAREHNIPIKDVFETIIAEAEKLRDN